MKTSYSYSFTASEITQIIYDHIRDNFEPDFSKGKLEYLMVFKTTDFPLFDGAKVEIITE
jgi:hypothetical protein